VTTVPLGEPTVDDEPADAEGSAGPTAGDGGAETGTGTETETGTGTEPTPSWTRDLGIHPIRAWERRGHRFLPGASFPVAVWAVWRVVHLAVSVYLGEQSWTLSERAVRVAYNYDGERYLAILHQGYANHQVVMPNTAFFPLTSWVAGPLWWVTRSDAWTVHLSASLTAIAAFVCIWGVSKAWRDERIARRAVLLFAIFPSSLFLWAFYSEALFIALGAGAVWADRKDRRGVAALLFVALATTRSVGILVPVVLVTARVIRNGPPLRETLRKPFGVVGAAVVGASFLAFCINPRFSLLLPAVAVFWIWAIAGKRLDRWCGIYLAASAVGFAVVLVVMWRQTGDPFAWAKVQGDWGRDIAQPWKAVKQGFENLYPKPDTIMVPALVARNFDLWCVPIIAFPLLYAALSRRDRFPMETWMLGAALIALPLFSSVLASFNRFVMADWVIYPVYASALARLPARWRWAPYVGLTVAAGFVAYAMIGRFSVDRFVG
jgi:hypothetical protein